MHRGEAASLRTLRPMAGFALFGTCVRMGASLLRSFLFRMAVPERPPTAPSDDR